MDVQVVDYQTENDVSVLLRVWEENSADLSWDPEPILTRISQLVELVAERYMKGDPDPFDERHPSRADPSCSFGQMLKIIFRKDNFMNKLINDYMRENYWDRLNIRGRNVRELNVAACRIMIDIMPGLETSVVFEPPTNDALVQRLYYWAEHASDPLQTYAIGLLAAAMEVQDIANSTRELNNRLVPIMLDKLREVHNQACPSSSKRKRKSNHRPFADFSKKNGRMVNGDSCTLNGETALSADSDALYEDSCDDNINSDDDISYEVCTTSTISFSVCNSTTTTTSSLNSNGWKRNSEGENSGDETSLVVTKKRLCSYNNDDCSNSSWAEMETFVFANTQIYPVTLATKQMFILKYLTPMGEYQEFLSHVIEKRALILIMKLIDRKHWQNSKVTFEALRYLAAILCHKKFAIEFINMRGLEKLLDIPRPGVAATGVSLCLFYLAHCEDAMERICLLPCYIISRLVRYALWLLECSHDSGRCHATMFFGLSFQFGVMLKEFDAQDGLRRMFNVLSTLPVLASDDNGAALNDDEECSARQIVRHVCTALKRYLEAHLYIKADLVQTAYYRDLGVDAKIHSIQPAIPEYKALKFSLEVLREQITLVSDYLCIKSQWSPVDDFTKLGGVMLMIKIVAFTYDWNYSGRAETVKSALDVINICAVSSKVLLQLCERADWVEDNNSTGIQVVLSAAEGEIVTDAEVQKSALNVIITCACAPLYKEGEFVRYFHTTSRLIKKKLYKLSNSIEEILQKVWESIRTSNGIMVLMTLMTVKTPITDADGIRALACQALAGLSRNETVRQIISKLPLFTSGQLQTLMKDPILQEKRQEHVMFQKYAVELMERVSGKSKPGPDIEVSLPNIHKANVVAQTKIQFNDKQLFQIIHQHLLKYGLNESANALQREANLPPLLKPAVPSNLSPFTYCRLARLSLPGPEPRNIKNVNLNQSISQINDEFSSPVTSKIIPSTSSPLPIKFNVNRKLESKLFTSPNRSLQKQVIRVDHISPNTYKESSHVTLDSIITEYLANQHSLCKNPMMTCPPFDILTPHKCPEPKPRKLLYGNITARYLQGVKMRRLDEQFIHSRFCHFKTFRLGEEDGYYTCCEFLNERQILVGTYQGDVKVLNSYSGNEEVNFTCHESYITNLVTNQDSTLLVTSSTWRNPLSALWKFGPENTLRNLHNFEEDEFLEFNNLGQDKLLATRGDTAVIYDIASCKSMMTLNPRHSNQYNKNKATFNPTDELVLSDGVLWDVTSGKEIHKFDKLNQTLSGVFHPNGLEIISNTEVWDIRTFHLLKTVPALDQSTVTFSPCGKVIYSIALEKELDDDSTYETSFRTLDSYDYSSIATIDVKKQVFHLACNRLDTQIAIVENSGQLDNVEESTVKVYDIGRKKEDDDDGEDEEDDEESDEEGSITDGDASRDGNEGGVGDVEFDDDEENDDDDDDIDPVFELMF